MRFDYFSCSGRGVTICPEEWDEVSSSNYFHNFTQATLSCNITTLNPNIAIFYLALPSRLEGHIKGEAWVCSSSLSKLKHNACQVCLQSLNCQISHILQASDSSQCFNSKKIWKMDVFSVARQRIKVSSHSCFNFSFLWIKSTN